MAVTEVRNEKALEHCCSRASRLVRLAGIEPTTPWFVAKYSIQLSYSRQDRNYSTVKISREPLTKEFTKNQAKHAPIGMRCARSGFPRNQHPKNFVKSKQQK
jgi:hypothetical protein